MTQQDKVLLLRYLSMALPYGVIVQVVKYGKCYDEREKKTTVDCKVVGINRYTLITDKDSVEHTYAKGFVSTPITVPIDDGDMKSLPYLRPLSSMTEEEINEFILISDTTLWLGNKRSTCILSIKQIDWLNKYHFDYLGLIEKDLAIEAPKNMYD